ncbi:MAG: TrmJ/YjtD family RNA methyltransferase [Candidatus Wallbacteria bacterium]|nr:TrmJ/YjtD family RNA methyltransferase [Candidatus Wallbacteria bacterium]
MAKQASFEPAKEYVENVRFVLVETRRAGNVGAAARALKNMGFRRLIRVGGPDIAENEARQMAVTARDVLDASEQVETIDEAVKGAVLVAATTRRMRAMIQPRPVFLRAAVRQLLEAARLHPVAVLFGNEKWGLAHEDLAHAGLLVRIPTNPSFGSLNVAQAVLLFAYEMRMALLDMGLAAHEKLAKSSRKLASSEVLEQLYGAARDSLVGNGFFPAHRVDNGMNTLRGIFSRARLEEREVKFLLGMFGRLGHAEE